MNPLRVRAHRTKRKVVITGNRDPRGPDNTIEVWLDEKDLLHIRVEKPALRCYPFREVVDGPGFIEVVQG